MSKFISTTEKNEAMFQSPNLEEVKHHKPAFDGFKFDFTRYTVKRTALGAKQSRCK